MSNLHWLIELNPCAVTGRELGQITLMLKDSVFVQLTKYSIS
jgi:hypothetical protein